MFSPNTVVPQALIPTVSITNNIDQYLPITLTKVVFPEYCSPTSVSSISSFQKRLLNQSRTLLRKVNILAVGYWGEAGQREKVDATTESAEARLYRQRLNQARRFNVPFTWKSTSNIDLGSVMNSFQHTKDPKWQKSCNGSSLLNMKGSIVS